MALLDETSPQTKTPEIANTHKWQELLTDRQRKELEFSRIYAKEFAHGTDGHNAKLLIAQLADILDAVSNSHVDVITLWYVQAKAESLP